MVIQTERLERMIIMTFKRKLTAAAGILLFCTVFLLAGTKPADAYTNYKVSADISNGGVEFFHTSDEKITADFDAEYYNVEIININNETKVTVTGRQSDMGHNYVKIYIPENGCAITADVVDGSLIYDLPQDCKNSLNITAKDSSVKISSPDQYKNYYISVTAENQDFITYGHMSYPTYFSCGDDKTSYKNGTGENEISILLTGYTNVDFKEQ